VRRDFAGQPCRWYEGGAAKDALDDDGGCGGATSFAGQFSAGWSAGCSGGVMNQARLLLDAR